MVPWIPDNRPSTHRTTHWTKTGKPKVTDGRPPAIPASCSMWISQWSNSVTALMLLLSTAYSIILEVLSFSMKSKYFPNSFDLGVNFAWYLHWPVNNVVRGYIRKQMCNGYAIHIEHCYSKRVLQLLLALKQCVSDDTCPSGFQAKLITVCKGNKHD